MNISSSDSLNNKTGTMRIILFGGKIGGKTPF
jgi:hypothetical protein